MNLRNRRALIGAYQESNPYTWEKLFAAIDNGTYASKYALGDLFPLDLGTGGVLNMQIVAFNTDTIAGTTDKAPVTLISKELYKTNHSFNPAYVSGTVGTGSIGGYAESALKAYVDSTIVPLIPQNVANRILTVSKTTMIYDTSDTRIRGNQTNETVTVPSHREMFGDTAAEQSGIYYSSFFNSDDARKKAKAGGSNTEYWTRSAASTSNIYIVTNAGASTYRVSTLSIPFPILFCVGIASS